MSESQYDAASDVSSDESIAGPPVPSSIARSDNPSCDEPFPFPVDELGDHSVPETADTSVISADAPSETSGHTPIVREQSRKSPLSILKRPRSDPEQVDPLNSST
jgi:hypothetical protein